MAAGSATVTVITVAGSSSAAVDLESVMPGLFTASNYVLSVRPADAVIINGTGAAIAGYTTAAAVRPGDVLEVFGTGLGTTTPGVSPGLVFSGACATTARPSVSFGSTPADVSYCGLVGAGLYQINLTVPLSLAAGTYPVIVTLNGAASPATAMMKVTGN
jgi:uncharacterized protein (TIGR03437 family)